MTVPAVGEELTPHTVGVEPGHRAGGQPGGADPDQQVADLEGGVQPRPVRRSASHSRACGRWEQLRQPLVEVHVGGEHRSQWRGDGLGVLAGPVQREQVDCDGQAVTVPTVVV
ncbi:hypothetical protein [Micromonospora lutea]|uniref:Uncharacterized protein n=1 Tax=Micromonospora lutea TaxID=419825 RepID=A0ABQ4J3D7_9ACTN|nr:hypothetical protein [Micromonospora lutea]GIJ24546.1 hypothetical protein Vlu01_51700 [Micromonospora lutea]